MANTLLLDGSWDISLDASGNLRSVRGDYAIAQNVANACRAFTEDMYFNQQDGVPHFLLDISTRPNFAVLTTYLEREALRVAEVATSRLTGLSITERVVEGDITVKTTSGEVFNVAI